MAVTAEASEMLLIFGLVPWAQYGAWLGLVAGVLGLVTLLATINARRHGPLPIGTLLGFLLTGTAALGIEQLYADVGPGAVLTTQISPNMLPDAEFVLAGGTLYRAVGRCLLWQGLSKSRIMSSLQCLKRVYLEINRKDLVHYSRATEAAFALGHEVGDIAIQLYGGPDSKENGGAFIEYNGGNFSGALAQTEELMTSMFRAPIFEATLQHDGVLVREDVLLPHTENGE